MKKTRNVKQSLKKVNKDYDSLDTSAMIDRSQRLKLADLGLKLPKTPPTQVVSIRLPSELLNQLRAIGSKRDVPYQALIKLMLAEAIPKYRSRKAAS